MDLITNNLDVWTSAQIKKNTLGRGSNGKQTAYGIKKLRELILELAVRGKLVPQDPKDEPARVLLEKIAKEKVRLIHEGKIKKQTPLPKIGEDEKPFDLPYGWEWARIGDVGHDWGQKTPDADFTYIDVSAIDNVTGIVKFPTMLSSIEAPSRARKIVKVGTVIYSTVRPYLKNICVIDQEYLPEPIASTAFAILHLFHEMPGKFFVIYFRSPEFVRYVESVQTGIAYPAINDKQFFGGMVPIPPLTEQNSIVAKVNELMALCDQLEQQQTDSNAAHQTLVEILLGTLTNPVHPKFVEGRGASTSSARTDFEAAWQRIAEHFDTLFTTEHSIDQLKQTILQLAVMGKLVHQDPNDVPASMLLEKIADGKMLLVQKGTIKKQKTLSEITEVEKLFELPKGWEWIRFSDISHQITDGTHHTPNYVSEGVPFLSVKDMSSGYLNFSNTRFITKEQHKELAKRCNPEQGDLLLTKVGTTGIPILIETDVEFNIFVSVALIKFPTDKICGKFLSLLIKSPFVKRQSDAGTEGIGNKNLVLRKIDAFLLAIPPLAEQHRIVAKVDELMTLCDALKTRINQAQTTQIHLADAIVELVNDG